MGTKIYLIRHGEIHDGEERRYNGHKDVPLSERGIDQIMKLSEFLRDAGLQAVYTSDLSRALKSAEMIARVHDREPVIEKGLKEFSFGEWEGMTFSEIEDKYPDSFGAWAANPVKFSPVGGESTEGVRTRAIHAFEKIIGCHQGENIAIVSHGGVIRIILCELLGIPLENIFRIEQNFAALNIVEMWDYPVIKLMNYIV
jgi:alpha-ribazole phosphatase/probable phosphoglycerate mutase